MPAEPGANGNGAEDAGQLAGDLIVRWGDKERCDSITAVVDWGIHQMHAPFRGACIRSRKKKNRPSIRAVLFRGELKFGSHSAHRGLRPVAPWRLQPGCRTPCNLGSLLMPILLSHAISPLSKEVELLLQSGPPHLAPLRSSPPIAGLSSISFSVTG